MFRLMGCVLLLCACVGMGVAAVMGLRARVVQLRGFLAALEEMAREVQFRLTPMPELLSNLGDRLKGPVGEFFRLCAGGLDGLDRRPFSKLWREALEATDLCLEEEDLLLLEELGNSLGRYDSRRQCEALIQTRDRLEENLIAAMDRRERLGRVYGALGLAAGAFLIIVLI